jgi:hypothetical protein
MWVTGVYNFAAKGAKHAKDHMLKPFGAAMAGGGGLA